MMRETVCVCVCVCVCDFVLGWWWGTVEGKAYGALGM